MLDIFHMYFCKTSDGKVPPFSIKNVFLLNSFHKKSIRHPHIFHLVSVFVSDTHVNGIFIHIEPFFLKHSFFSHFFFENYDCHSIVFVLLNFSPPDTPLAVLFFSVRAMFSFFVICLNWYNFAGYCFFSFFVFLIFNFISPNVCHWGMFFFGGKEQNLPSLRQLSFHFFL